MSPQMIDRLWQALFDTLYMVGVSSLITVILGIPLAVFLVVSSRDGILPAPTLNRVVGLIINGFRAVPFIVLMVALIPFTRFLVGKSIGVWAAIVPLSIATIPFFARIAEVCLREVDKGLIEAAQSIGCRRWHIIRHVLLPEALPSILGGLTITIITMIGASAVAGTVGAGGLGDIAYRYGYQRSDSTTMAVVITALILLVSLVQLVGDVIVRRLRNR